MMTHWHVRSMVKRPGSTRRRRAEYSLCASAAPATQPRKTI